VRSIVILALALTPWAATGCDSKTPSASPPSPSASAAPRPPRPPKPISLPTATSADLREALDRLGWSVGSDLSTEFDSCKSTVLDVSRGDHHGRVTLHDCSDEYDARRKQTATIADDTVVDRVGGRMLETTVTGNRAEATKLHAAVLGR